MLYLILLTLFYIYFKNKINYKLIIIFVMCIFVCFIIICVCVEFCIGSVYSLFTCTL